MPNKILWCNETLNVVVGCSPVSAGCDNCYAARMASRFSGMGEQFQGLTLPSFGKYTWSGDIEFHAERLGKPFRWKKPRRIFITSLGDLWHPSISNEQIAAVFGVIAACPQHIFMDLTKRPDRRLEWFDWIGKIGIRLSRIVLTNPSVCGPESSVCAMYSKKHMAQTSPIDRFLTACEFPPWPPTNYWCGVSVEDQRTADERIPLLLQTPAEKHFVSYEPAIEGVDFDKWIGFENEYKTRIGCNSNERSIGKISLIITGAETGPHKRPMDLDWARSVRDQCAAACVPFWFKKDSYGNEVLDGMEHHPEFWK